jgi:hypothetical protein
MQTQMQLIVMLLLRVLDEVVRTPLVTANSSNLQQCGEKQRMQNRQAGAVLEVMAGV